MADLKTKPTDQQVTDFLNSVADEKRRRDCFTILELMENVTKTPPKMWGSSIVGFGSYHYKYASGHEGDAPRVGFSPRKEALTLYIMRGFEQYDALLQQLGKYKTGKACLYIKKIEEVDLPTLQELVRQSVDYMRKLYP
ncbi:MAG: DUF1801 domain-containing protein [Chloroflexi bacterium]|nr:DUF1801 domain-containing protein [Chloroflexota bacterium]